MAAGSFLETPHEARARRARGEPTPAHYLPTQPLGMTAAQAQAAKSPYD
jgi:hypothetical protein